MNGTGTRRGGARQGGSIGEPATTGTELCRSNTRHSTPTGTTPRHSNTRHSTPTGTELRRTVTRPSTFSGGSR